MFRRISFQMNFDYDMSIVILSNSAPEFEKNLCVNDVFFPTYKLKIVILLLMQSVPVFYQSIFTKYWYIYIYTMYESCANTHTRNKPNVASLFLLVWLFTLTHQWKKPFIDSAHGICFHVGKVSTIFEFSSGGFAIWLGLGLNLVGLGAEFNSASNSHIKKGGHRAQNRGLTTNKGVETLF
jgi:hypothetical protein